MTSDLPSGTVTFLFTDIEGSTRLWQEKPEAMSVAQSRHDAILREAIESHHGYVFQTAGDSFSAAFPNAIDAFNAALAAQRGLHTQDWGKTGALKVRMGLHTGAAAISGDGKYEGYTTIACVQRIMSLASGGQVLLSQSTFGLLQDVLAGDVSLRDVGEHQLKGLHAPLRLYQLIAPDLQQEFPPIQSLHEFPNNLPPQLTSFIGRVTEIQEIKGVLDSARLVTLTGSGGTGKTRLSQEVGARLLTDFRHGVWLAELAPLSDEAQIIPTLAQVFGLQELPFIPLANVVEDYLRHKELLLILDNCEHLIAACARLADHLLHQCTGLKILASSREALGIAGEVAYRTPSLGDSESTQLFVARARAANPRFSVTDSNASAIAQICRRLDGIPLAIELAAARTKLLSAEQIAARLDDMFRLLVGGSRTALPRQQTLRALVDWSYDLLSNEEKRLLEFASVFVGGWTLDALEFVAEDPDTLELLQQLVNKSLVVAEERDREMRYSMLETIRQYSREKLFEAKEASAARDRHCVYFDELSEKMWDAFRSDGILPMIPRAADEVENFRAAMEWGLENRTEENLRLAGNFAVVASNMLGIFAEGVTATSAAIERARALPPAAGRDAEVHRQELIAKALFMQAMTGIALGNMPQVIQTLREAIAISRVTGDKRILGYSLEMYYIATDFLHAPDQEEAALEGFHIFTREMDDQFGMTMAHMNMARIAAAHGNRAEMEMYYGKVREKINAAAGTYQLGLYHLGFGFDESMRGNYQAAKQIFEDGLQITKNLRNHNMQLAMRSEIGHIERHMGNLSRAKAIYLETIKGWQGSGNRSAIAHQLECFAFLALADEESQHAARLFGAAEALRESIASPMRDQEHAEYDQHVSQLRSMLPESELHALWSEGRALTMEQAIQLALVS